MVLNYGEEYGLMSSAHCYQSSLQLVAAKK